MNSEQLIRRFLAVKRDARRSRDHWVRTGDVLWLEISMIERQLARKLHAVIMQRMRGFKSPKGG